MLKWTKWSILNLIRLRQISQTVFSRPRRAAKLQKSYLRAQRQNRLEHRHPRKTRRKRTLQHHKASQLKVLEHQAESLFLNKVLSINSSADSAHWTQVNRQLRKNLWVWRLLHKTELTMIKPQILTNYNKYRLHLSQKALSSCNCVNLRSFSHRNML